MSDHWSDDERVAAFLDGKMDPREREEMVRRLTRNAEDREVLAGTASILRQLEEAGGTGRPEPETPIGMETVEAVGPEVAPPVGVISLESRRTTTADPGRDASERGKPLRWLAIAAVLVGAALVTGRVLRGDGGLAGEPVRLARHVPRGLPTHWADNRPWGTRGDGTDSSSATQRSALSAQAGMMLVDLAVAVEAGDSVETRLLAKQIGERFDSLAWERNALGEIATNAAAGPKQLRPRIGEATARLAERMDSAALRLGAWTEASALAAARRDARFFSDRGTGQVPANAEQVTAADSLASAALKDVRRRLETNPPAWEDLVRALDRLARALATD